VRRSSLQLPQIAQANAEEIYERWYERSSMLRFCERVVVGCQDVSSESDSNVSSTVPPFRLSPADHKPQNLHIQGSLHRRSE
jgi:hypothetical protein